MGLEALEHLLMISKSQIIQSCIRSLKSIFFEDPFLLLFTMKVPFLYNCVSKFLPVILELDKYCIGNNISHNLSFPFPPFHLYTIQCYIQNIYNHTTTNFQGHKHVFKRFFLSYLFLLWYIFHLYIFYRFFQIVQGPRYRRVTRKIKWLDWISIILPFLTIYYLEI